MRPLKVSAALVTLVLSGCDARLDLDGDEYSARYDCDDLDPARNPEAAERCDGVDNDCDGVVDEADAVDAPSWFPDGDGDGYGADVAGTPSCEALAGYSALNTDCDDGDAARSPGAPERCDGVENDCDAETDEADSIDAHPYYPDSDGDGYGKKASPTMACEQPSGHSSLSTDCDDSDATTNPLAEERCDGADDDCDGVIDEDDAVDAATWYLDGDGDGVGGESVTTLACALPSGYAATSTDCDDTDPATSPDAQELCDGEDDDCDGAVDEDDAADAPSWYPDADGDGYGAEVSATLACEGPSGFTTDSSDCDDADADAYPGSAVTPCTTIPSESLLIVTELGEVYAWASGDGAPTLLTTVPNPVSVRRGESGDLNIEDSAGAWITIDPTTGAELSNTTVAGGGIFVDCGGLSWSLSSRSVTGWDETGAVLTVSLSAFDTSALGAVLGADLAAEDGALYVGYMSPYRGWRGGVGAFDCATGSVLSNNEITHVERLLVDHGAVVALGEFYSSSWTGGVFSWDAATGSALMNVGSGPVELWGGPSDGVQFIQYWSGSYTQHAAWMDATGAMTSTSVIGFGVAHDNLALLMDGADPAQIWVIGADYELDVYEVTASGASWSFAAGDALSLGRVMFLDTAER